MGGVDDARDLQQQRQQSQRQSILAATDNGHAGPTGYTTDFTAHSVGGLIGLRSMIEDADPEQIQAVADKWQAVHDALTEAQNTLQSHTSAALDHWQGAAADGFANRSDELHQSLGNGAAYAGNAGAGVSEAADALRTAKAAMPAVPSEAERAARWATSETNANQFNADLRSGISRSAAIKLDGGQLSLLEERHQQAIVVMQQLESRYHGAAGMVGSPPRETQSGSRAVFPPEPPTGTSAGTAHSGGAVASPDAARTSGSRNATGNPASPDDSLTVSDGISGGIARVPGRQSTGLGEGPGVVVGERPGPAPQAWVDLPGGGMPFVSRSRRGASGTAEENPPESARERMSETGRSGAQEAAGEAVDGRFAGRAGTEAPLGETTTAREGMLGEGAFKSPEGATERGAGGLGGAPVGGRYADSAGERESGRRPSWIGGEDEPAPAGEEFAGGDGIGEFLSHRPARENAHAFTRGGSGLLHSDGERAEESGSPEYSGVIGTAASRRHPGKDRERPDFLIEDDDTWNGGDFINPPVVE